MWTVVLQIPSSVPVSALKPIQKLLHLLAVLWVSALRDEAETEEVTGQGSLLGCRGHRCSISYGVVITNKPSAPMESAAIATIQLNTANRKRDVL